MNNFIKNKKTTIMVVFFLRLFWSINVKEVFVKMFWCCFGGFVC